ncbi:MAG: heavy metal translocating P-type ATPase metal-binding domain-containing protein [Fibrobacterales bacterium]
MSQCIHCHDSIIHEPIVDAVGNQFCCNGCLQVYEIIQSNDGLDFYYTLLEAEKSRAPKVIASNQSLLNTLNNSQDVSAIGIWKGAHHTISLYSNEIHCSACGWLLETVLKKEFVGIAVYVDFFRGVMELTYDSNLYSLQGVLQYCHTFGYTFNAVATDAAPQVSMSKSLLIRIAVSGAIFLNIMMFSLGIYFGMFTGIDSDWVSLFSWYSLFLSLPVVTYCSYPFYQKAWQGLRRKVLHMDLPVAIGILCTSVVSLYLTLKGEHGYYDSVSGLVFFLLIGRWVVQRFERSLVIDSRWFEGIKTDLVKKVTPNGIEDTPIEFVENGDEIVLFPDEYIPIDGTLSTPVTWLDKSLLTGESDVEKITSGSTLFAGYKNLKERIVIKVTNSESRNRIKQLKNQFDLMVEEKNRNSEQIEKIVPWFIGFVLICASLTFWVHYSEGLEFALIYSASVLVVSCPCALALAKPLNYGLALKRLSALGLYSKKHDIIDTLQKVDAVLFDKTGTLTMTEREITGWCWEDKLSQEDKQHLYGKIAQLTEHSLHPVSVSIQKSIVDQGVMEVQSRIAVMPLEIVGLGLRGEWHSESRRDVLYVCSARVLLDSFDFSYIVDSSIRNELQNIKWNNGVKESSIDSLLVYNGSVVATITFKDVIKRGVVETVEYLNRQKIETVLVSGDIQNQVDTLLDVIPFKQGYAEQTPEEKHHVLSQFQSDNSIVAIGDGFNDSLLIASADIGVVVKGGAEYLGHGADVLLISPNFDQFINLFHIPKKAGLGVKLCYALSILYNIFAISLALLGLITPLWAAILMPLSSVSIAIVALLTVTKYPSHSENRS